LEDCCVASVELTNEQIVELVRQLPVAAKRDMLIPPDNSAAFEPDQGPVLPRLGLDGEQ